MSDMWSLGAVISFIANKGVHLFKSEQAVKKWPGGKSTLDRSAYSIELRQLTADLLSPTVISRPSAEKMHGECRKGNRTKNPSSLKTVKK